MSLSIRQLTRASTIAAWVAIALSSLARDSFAGHLDAAAYDITSRPKPGPVEEFQPIKSLPPVPFELPFDWGMDPFDDLSWQSNLHKLRQLVDSALAAGDFEWPREVFRDWQRWHQRHEAPRSWGDAVTGARAARLAYLLHSTGWRDRSLIELAEEHVARLRGPGLASLTNHGIAQVHGLAALCLDDKLSACRGAKVFLERRLDELLRSQFIRSGVHRENSPGYHFYALDHLSRMAALLEEYLPDLGEILARAENKRRWLVHPDLTTVALGDSEPKLRSAVQLPRGDLPCNGIASYGRSPDCYMLRHFKKVGYVIARSDWAIPAAEASMLFVQGGFFNITHRDADDFSFEWFERGRKILSDGGKYGYTRDEWEDYFDSTRAHNTIEVDGRNYSRLAGTYGSAVRSAQRMRSGIRIILQVRHADLGLWHRRQIDYRPGEELRIRDDVRSDRVRTYVQWHHFSHLFELTGGGGDFEIDDGELLAELTTSTSCGDETEYKKVRGQREPRIQGWESVKNRERRRRWALGVECQARNATFEARYELD